MVDTKKHIDVAGPLHLRVLFSRLSLHSPGVRQELTAAVLFDSWSIVPTAASQVKEKLNNVHMTPGNM
jgi:hypothetical protein